MPKGKETPVSSSAIKNPFARNLAIIGLLILGFLGVYYAYTASYLILINQILLAMLIVVGAGLLIRIIGRYQGWSFMYLLSTTKGITTIDRISKTRKDFWTNLSLWGIVLGLGLLSYPFLKGRISKKLYVFGIISLYLMFAVVQPYTISGVQFISLAQIQTLVQGLSPSTIFIPASPLAAVLYAITIVSGFTGYVIALLLTNTVSILIGIAQFFTSVAAGHPQTSTLSNQVPGVIPVIPGITVPLVAGLIAIVVLLVVHEGSHGVLARISKVNLKSVGLLMFGIIPIGAFVEPDEKQVGRLDSMKQTMIFAAGSSMNFLFSVVFFVLVYLMSVYIVSSLYSIQITAVAPNMPANGILHPGMQLLEWNGHQISNLTDMVAAGANDTPNSIVTLVTNTGTYKIPAISINGSARGYIGIDAGPVLENTPSAGFYYFLYSVFALSLMFNFFVAIFNLLPVPMFDGWRIYKTNVKKNSITKAIAWVIVICLVVNVLALFFRLLL